MKSHILLTITLQSNVSSESSSISTRPPNTYRHSLEMKMEQKFADAVSDTAPAANNGTILTTPPKLQNSLSANDVPTLKTVVGASVGSTPNHAAQQHLQNHNANMGRIPAGALPNRHSRELSADGRDNGAAMGYQSIGSTLHANAAPFGPTLTQTPGHLQGSGLVAPQTPQSQAGNHIISPLSAVSAYSGTYTPSSYSNGLLYGGGPHTPYTPMNGSGLSSNSSINGNSPYNMSQLSMQMNGLSVNGTPGYSPGNYGGYNSMFTPPQQRDSQARVIQSRRQQDNDGRFTLSTR